MPARRTPQRAKPATSKPAQPAPAHRSQDATPEAAPAVPGSYTTTVDRTRDPR